MVGRRELQLPLGRGGTAVGADLLVRPALVCDPGQRVIAIRARVAEDLELAFREIAATFVLADIGITPVNRLDDLAQRPALQRVHVVGRADKDGGHRPGRVLRPVDVRRKANTVAHRHQHLALDDRAPGEFRLQRRLGPFRIVRQARVAGIGQRGGWPGLRLGRQADRSGGEGRDAKAGKQCLFHRIRPRRGAGERQTPALQGSSHGGRQRCCSSRAWTGLSSNRSFRLEGAPDNKVRKAVSNGRNGATRSAICHKLRCRDPRCLRVLAAETTQFVSGRQANRSNRSARRRIRLVRCLACATFSFRNGSN